MFFRDSQTHFFNPLTGKYREVVVECLRLLYQKLYTDLHDYQSLLDRHNIVAVFMEAIARNPVVFDDDDRDGEGRFKNQRELAGFILNKLLEFGWLECQVDSATLTSHYAFTRTGRLFTQPLLDAGKLRLHTRHRNTRNARNSLQAFADRGEYSDLLDAYDYSERIISDFSDIIAELADQRRELVREMENEQLIHRASDQFFDFMEKRFMPDLAIRLSADSVEKHRDAIAGLIHSIKTKKSKTFLADAERELRQVLPQLVAENTQRSVLYYLLEAIERRLREACDTMLPQLRGALNSFTRRAETIMRQLSYLNNGQSDALINVCRDLRTHPKLQNNALNALQPALQNCQLRCVDPGQNQLRQRRPNQTVLSRVAKPPSLDQAARKEHYVQQVLDQAFAFQGGQLRDYVHKALLDTGVVNSRFLPVNSAHDLLKLCHVIEVASADNLDSDYHFSVTELGRLEQQDDDYLIERDIFEIKLHHTTESA